MNFVDIDVIMDMRIKGDNMDFLISFFRDTLDGGLYYVVVVICLILIMAIIGFIMEKAKLAKEESMKTVVIADSNGNIVSNQEAVSNSNAATNVSNNVIISDEVVDNTANPVVQNDSFIDFGSTTDTNNDKLNSSDVLAVDKVQQPTQQVLDQNQVSNQVVTDVGINTNSNNKVDINNEVVQPDTNNQETVVIPPIVQAVNNDENIF